MDKHDIQKIYDNWDRYSKKEQEELLSIIEAEETERATRNEIFSAYRMFKGRYAVLIGGSGSGKSYEIADKQLDRLVHEDGHRILCTRAEQKQISESQVPLIVSRIKARYEKSYLTDQWKINLSKGHESVTYLPNGNCFIFWGLDDPEKLKSIFDITSVWVEEADQIEAADLREIERRLRGYQGKNKNGSDKYMQISFSFNPVHETCYIKPLFFDNKEPHQIMLCGVQPFDDCTYYKKIELPDFNEKIQIWDETQKKYITRHKVNTLVIHSTYLDNKFIDDTYSQVLLKQKEEEPEEYNVYGLGQWGVYGNVFFKEFNKKIHVIEPFPIPEHWKKYTTKDYGLDMLANLWIAIDTHNNAYVYKELCKSDLVISEAAQSIKKMNGNDNIVCKYAPPDFKKRDNATGKTWFTLFADNGEKLVESSNRREEGWMAVKEWLKVYETKDEATGETIKTSRLKIFSNCVNLIRCLPQLKQAEDNPNDVETEPHEITHAPDALRGFCIMRQRPPEEQGASEIKQGGTYTYQWLKMMGYKEHQIKKWHKEGYIKIIGMR
jgi:phage terminase large subunit